jgi:hypothetical protein
MAVLTAAVIVIGILCLTDLLLTFGVIRRLREQSAIHGGASAAELSVSGLDAGETPGQFAGVSTSGEQVTGPAGFRLVAFFSSWCSVCPKRVPVFVDYIQANQVGHDSVLAVVTGSDAEPVPYLGRLAEVAQVCVEPDDGDLAMAFKVTGYPAFCLLDADGALLAVSHDPDALPTPVAV